MVKQNYPFSLHICGDKLWLSLVLENVPNLVRKKRMRCKIPEKTCWHLCFSTQWETLPKTQEHLKTTSTIHCYCGCVFLKIKPQSLHKCRQTQGSERIILLLSKNILRACGADSHTWTYNLDHLSSRYLSLACRPRLFPLQQWQD